MAAFLATVGSGADRVMSMGSGPLGSASMQESFWELHRKLGEKYEHDLRCLERRDCVERNDSQRKHRRRPSSQEDADLGALVRSRRSGRSEQGPRSDTPPVLDVVDPPNPALVSSDRSLEEVLGVVVPGLAPAAPTSGRSKETRTASFVGSEEDGRKGRTSRCSSAFSEDTVFLPRKQWASKSRTNTVMRRKSRGSLTGDLSSLMRDQHQLLQQSEKLIEATSPWTFRCRPRFVALNPTGNFRSFWDFLGILLLVKDTVGIPLQLVDVEVADVFPAWTALSAMSVFYWIGDIVLSFFTGYLERGTLVQDAPTIARHYLRTWFLVDLAVSLTDVMLEFGHMTDSLGESATASRFLRFLRIFRMLRLGKVSRVSAFLQDSFESEVASIQFSLFLVMVAMFLVEHVIACFWFGLGGDGGWLADGAQDTLFTQYSASMRWALAQLGFGATVIEARTEAEGMYSNFVGFISLVTSSSVISSMTSLVSALHRNRSEETKQLGQLRRFLRQNRVDPNLGERIMRFLQYTYQERTSTTENPQILQLLSKQLRAELQLQRYKVYLERITFVQRLLENEPTSQEERVLQQMAMESILVADAGEDDVIFAAGGMAEACYFVVSGSFRYSLEDRGPCAVDFHTGVIAEACLWTDWDFVGELISTSFSKLVVIKADEFMRSLCSMPELHNKGFSYALEFVEALNGMDLLSDLWHLRHHSEEAVSKKGGPQHASSWFSWTRWLRFQVSPE